MIREHSAELFATVAAGAVWLCAQAAHPLLTPLMEHGTLAALVGFFVWTSWQRENRLATRITMLEQKTPELLERVVHSMDNHAEAARGLAVSISDMKETIKELSGE